MDFLNLFYLITGIIASLISILIVIWPVIKGLTNYFLKLSKKKSNSPLALSPSYQPRPKRFFKFLKWEISRNLAIILTFTLIGLVTLGLFIRSQFTTSQILSGPTDTGYNSQVQALSWSPEGKRIAIASNDGVYLWDVAARRRTVISTYQSIDAVVWSLNGNFIAFGGASTPVQIWNVTTGEQSSLISGYSSGVNAIAWSPNGKLIAFGGDDGKVGVYSLITKKVIFEYPNPASVSALSWSHDGNRIASGGKDGTIEILDATTGKDIIRPFLAYNNSVLSLEWSPTNALLASAGEMDTRVQIWDATKNYPENQVITINNPGGWWVNGIAWSPHDNDVASVDNGGTLRIWDALSGDDLTTYSDYAECPRTILALSNVIWSSDGKSLAFSHNEVIGSACSFYAVKVVILCSSWCFIPSVLHTLGIES